MPKLSVSFLIAYAYGKRVNGLLVAGRKSRTYSPRPPRPWLLGVEVDQAAKTGPRSLIHRAPGVIGLGWRQHRSMVHGARSWSATSSPAKAASSQEDNARGTAYPDISPGEGQQACLLVDSEERNAIAALIARINETPPGASCMCLG